MEQMSLFDMNPLKGGNLRVVKAKFESVDWCMWNDLFTDFDELYAITYSSGISFMETIFERFKKVETIFGCEGVLDDDIAAIISMQTKTVEEIVKCKSARKMADRIEAGTLELRVSRDTKSHEKIFILKADDGRTRVITGSANLSASAFLGIQREDIVCFDDKEAYEYYKNIFEEFKDKCSDCVSEKLISSVGEDDEYIRDNIEEVPIIRAIENKKIVILEPSVKDDEAEIVANIKGLEAEVRPLLPNKIKSENGKVLLTGEIIKSFKRKYDDNKTVKQVRQKKLPKLHIDYENKKMDFNGKDMNLNPEPEKIKKDILCYTNFIESLAEFHGDYKKSQRDYYKFLNWYFCSPIMPYLRYVGFKNEYGIIPFPVIGILYGDSNGGKTTFLNLLSKLMSGVKVTPNSSSDFTSTNIEALKCSCEGLPINIDDLAKTQYEAHFEKIIKDDNWGILEHKINYPSVVISTNKLSSLKPDISKRVVTCRVDIRIDKEKGAYGSKRINESMKQATNAFYCEYMRRMFEKIDEMVAMMKEGDESYFPDIFKISANVLKDLFAEYIEAVPEYVTELSYPDYFGDLAVGKHAIDQIKFAWQNEPKRFKVDKKKNKLIYTYPERGRLHELKYLQEELPPALEAQLTATSLVMKLDVAEEIFGEKFKKKLFSTER